MKRLTSDEIQRLSLEELVHIQREYSALVEYFGGADMNSFERLGRGAMEMHEKIMRIIYGEEQDPRT
jgi:hypothetical protein